MRNYRLTYEKIYSIYLGPNPYGTTKIPGYGEVVAKVIGLSLPDFLIPEKGTAVLIVYTPRGEVEEYVPFEKIEGWTPYYGPIPPPFGHTGGLPGGMGGQGWGQGQAFPSPWGGQGGQGGWSPWGGGY